MSGDEPEGRPRDDGEDGDEEQELSELTAEIAGETRTTGQANATADESGQRDDGGVDDSGLAPGESVFKSYPDDEEESPTESSESIDQPVDASEPAGEPTDAAETPTEQSDGPAESAGGTDTPGGTSPDPDRETVEVAVRPNLARAWERQADHAKLSLSEYLVRMVEAGRMSVQMQPAADQDNPAMTVEEVAKHIESELQHEDHIGWDDIVETLVEDLEQTVEEALVDLQERGVVRYSGLHGGYQLTDED